MRLEVFRATDQNGKMKTRNRSACLALLLLFLTAALAITPQAFAGSDDQAIIAGTRKYLAAQSYPADMKITVEKVDGDYARVAITPKDPTKMDGAIAFLKREHGQWKGLDIGTGWDPADLAKLHIPKSLRP
jgi:hypothetical protein